MKNKYYDAICALSEILLEQNNELNWKETQLDMKDNEIEKLKSDDSMDKKISQDIVFGRKMGNKMYYLGRFFGEFPNTPSMPRKQTVIEK